MAFTVHGGGHATGIALIPVVPALVENLIDHYEVLPRNGNCGPYYCASNGNLYMLLMSLNGDLQLRVYASSDLGVTWAQQDATHSPVYLDAFAVAGDTQYVGLDPTYVGACQSGNSIYFAYIGAGTVLSGVYSGFALTIGAFDMIAETFSTVAAAGPLMVTGTSYGAYAQFARKLSILPQSTGGGFTLFYDGPWSVDHSTASGSNPYNAVSAVAWTPAGGWYPPVTVPFWNSGAAGTFGGQFDAYNGPALSSVVAGASGRMHVFAQLPVSQYTSATYPYPSYLLWELHAITMRANGTFSGESVVIASGVLANATTAPFAIGTSCLDGAGNVWVGYVNPDGEGDPTYVSRPPYARNFAGVISAADADSPTWSYTHVAAEDWDTIPYTGGAGISDFYACPSWDAASSAVDVTFAPWMGGEPNPLIVSRRQGSAWTRDQVYYWKPASSGIEEINDLRSVYLPVGKCVVITRTGAATGVWILGPLSGAGGGCYCYAFQGIPGLCLSA
jgi:hypothetical protein